MDAQTRLEAHPAADLFPMHTAAELAALEDSIREHGWDETHPIVRCEGKILDGRNRYRVCLDLGVEPTFVDFVGNPFEKAWAENGARRDIETGQKVAIRLRVNAKSAEWQAAHEKRHVEAARKRSEAAKEQHAVSNPRAGEKSGHVSRDTRPERKPSKDNWARTALAQQAGASEGTAARALAVANFNPDLLDQVADGKLRLTEAHRKVKAARVRHREAVTPSGRYRVIYADPPWSYGNTQPDYHTEQRDHYPVMSMAELKAMPVAEWALDDAVLFLWVTSPILPEALDLVSAWGFKYKASFVWDKVKHNMGHYNSVRHEFLFVCVRGSCQPDVRKLFDSVVTEERTRHSRKPAVFREMIQTIYTHGPYLEMFARERVDGWDAYGNEA